ncbi:DUF6188 family protein [Streptomyces sp. NBC_01104]|uniref:DUF6188 family protein n=1 Tax=Streptomyces sp. NBC_01104 TaxID=2903750 RepID=UPI00386919F6|nr:DUF6188 family protein [Streptomyces sp. NBC_01104]
MENGIERVEDGWDVRPIRGVGVGEVTVGNTMRLHIGPHGIEVWSPAELTADGVTCSVHAYGRINPGRMPQLLDQVVAEVHAADSGVLRVRFANGWRLDVPVPPEGPGGAGGLNGCGDAGWIVALRGRHFLRPTPGGGVRISGRRREQG